MQYITITHLNNYIKNSLESDFKLKNMYVVGEISNLKKHYSGHIYLSLKDENSKINAVIFQSYAKNIKCDLEDGMKVVVRCSIGVYPSNGAYQLYINALMPLGRGDLQLKFEQLKKKLYDEGLFDENKKKPLVTYPSNIGVISAPNGAAIQDVISTIKRRWPICNITLLVSLMQGESASNDVINKLKQADEMNFDCIIIARGGGSIEDLWPFNNEELAYLVNECKTPIISAIGHETDFTILDFVSDKRAPTPTGAAEMATPNINDVLQNIEQYKKRLITAFNKNLSNIRTYFDGLKKQTSVSNLEKMYESKMLKVDALKSRMINAYKDNIKNVDKLLNDYDNRLNKYIETVKNEYKIRINNDYNNLINSFKNYYLNTKNNYQNILVKYNALNPINNLARGYSVVSKDDKIIKSIKDVEINNELNIKLSDGSVTTIVKGVKENERN